VKDLQSGERAAGARHDAMLSGVQIKRQVAGWCCVLRCGSLGMAHPLSPTCSYVAEDGSRDDNGGVGRAISRCGRAVQETRAGLDYVGACGAMQGQEGACGRRRRMLRRCSCSLPRLHGGLRVALTAAIARRRSAVPLGRRLSV
jgi:hypothetical protein